MDIVFQNALIPDFDNLKFIKKNVGIKNGTIKTVSDKHIDADKVIDADGYYLTPGMIDCHCHIESSHLIPSKFGDKIVEHGVLHVVADCHEISNVKGRRGLEFFIQDAKNSLCNIKFAVPSCVPATNFATSGGSLDLNDIEYFLKQESVVALGELMNVPAIINKDEKFMKMINLAKKYNKRVNGHAPHLMKEALKQYISAGVEDDHESESYKELLEKIQDGLMVFIREGSAEHTQDDAYKIIKEYPDKVSFCTDDKTIEDISKTGSIDYNFKKAIHLGIEPILSLKIASYNGLKYYNLDEFSEIKEGNRAYCVLFDKNFNVVETVLDGKLYKKGKTSSKIPKDFLNSINIKSDARIPQVKCKDICISVTNGSLITEKLTIEDKDKDFDVANDILKIVNFERYGHNNSASAKIKGFGLKKGAIASSVAHDCHNILAVGTTDESIMKVVNKIIEIQGGLALYDEHEIFFLPLQIGGIVTDSEPEVILATVEKLKEKAKNLGSSLSNPFATLSFMALEVIPYIKLTDKGLFDVAAFDYVKCKQ